MYSLLYHYISVPHVVLSRKQVSMFVAQRYLCGDGANQATSFQFDNFVPVTDKWMHFTASLWRENPWWRTVSICGTIQPTLRWEITLQLRTNPWKSSKGSLRVTLNTVSLVNGLNAMAKDIDSDMEFLVVRDSCSVTWMSYVTGNQMPTRAVVGGRKSNGGPLFVGSLWVTRSNIKSKYSYGCFDPETQMGYAFHTEALSNSSVDIMVEH